MRWEIRPLGPWTEPVTEARRSSAVFRADWQSTLDKLGYETGLLGAELVVVQVDAKDDDLRRDGMLRARARVGFPGVRVSFTSRHGPLMYATDAYEDTYTGDMPGWQANVRAIALALEALRAVDRYGVSRRGEQYTGWRAIETGGQPTMSRQEAAELIARLAGGDWTAEQVLRDGAAQAYRAAARTHHPDAGGNHDVMARLSLAREILGRT